jgi:hypothetical protein
MEAVARPGDERAVVLGEVIDDHVLRFAWQATGQPALNRHDSTQLADAGANRS